jgi:hypothetical protein
VSEEFEEGFDDDGQPSEELEPEGWLPANFKDGPSLAKSYAELQAAYTRGQQEAAELRRVNQELVQVFEAAIEEQATNGYDAATNGHQVPPEELQAFIAAQTAAYVQAGQQRRTAPPVPQGPTAEDVALAEARAREAEAQFETARLAKLGAQTNAGSGGRPEPAGDSDEEFARSLLEAHGASYASRMSRKGL